MRRVKFNDSEFDRVVNIGVGIISEYLSSVNISSSVFIDDNNISIRNDIDNLEIIRFNLGYKTILIFPFSVPHIEFKNSWSSHFVELYNFVNTELLILIREKRLSNFLDEKR